LYFNRHGILPWKPIPLFKAAATIKLSFFNSIMVNDHRQLVTLEREKVNNGKYGATLCAGNA
jgi:hypothetical protein